MALTGTYNLQFLADAFTITINLTLFLTSHGKFSCTENLIDKVSTRPSQFRSVVQAPPPPAESHYPVVIKHCHGLNVNDDQSL